MKKQFGRSVTRLAAFLLGSAALAGTMATARTAAAVSEPAIDEAPSGATETIVLAGGCFWGVQSVFQHVKGVQNAVSGYSGGASSSAHYAVVSSGTTGHAEAVRISFDPHVISYGRILQIYFSVVADPTELNRQGPDSGTQYRSAIFAANTKQREVATAYVSQLGKAGIYGRPLVTQVTELSGFYPAESYHQDFASTHPNNAYIAIKDAPKVENLRRAFPDYYRAKPALVQDAGLTE